MVRRMIGCYLPTPTHNKKGAPVWSALFGK